MRGETVFVDGSPVDGVLVHIAETSSPTMMEATSITDLIGPIADYILYFPDDYTDDLAGKTIEVRGIACDVIGHPDHERAKSVFDGWSFGWDMIVRVKRTIGKLAEHVQIIATIVTKNALGIRTGERDEVIYDGKAQARMSSGRESDGYTGTTSNSEYIFVVDWLDAFDDYQTQQLRVVYDGKDYNVTSIEDKDEERQIAVIRGEWRG